MATVTGQGTTFSLPNYTGELYQISPSDTPFLSAIGGLNSGAPALSVQFEWQTESLEATSANNSKPEGSPAPTATEVARSNVSNVVEIHQEAIQVSYTKQAAVGMHNGINAEGINPVRDELTHQVSLKLKKVAIDVEKSFLSGTYSLPANTASARQTQGILGAIATNVFANGGTARPLAKSIIDTALAGMYANGAQLSMDNTVIMTGPSQKIALSNVYAAPGLAASTASRTVGGVNMQELVTDFGTFGLMLNRWMPAGQIAILDLSVCQPRFLIVPGKGLLFVEPLAKTGAYDQYQLYGEIGLEYGPENFHGLIKDLA